MTIQIFVGKVMSLLFNMLSRFVIAFLPRSIDFLPSLLISWLVIKPLISRFVIAFLPSLLISWLQSLSAVILEPKEIKSVTVSSFSPSICHEVMGPDAMILVF